ncbi:MAG: S8 family serine peptidase [Ignavibacteriaceae bacterium]|nr:S8 family serine peptidase [Ignavibacteriaceae bacterium]
MKPDRLPGLFIFFFFLTALFNSTPAQTTFFVKLKNSVPDASVEKILASGDLFAGKDNRPFLMGNTRIQSLGKMAGIDDPVLNRIMRVSISNKWDNSALRALSNSDPDLEYVQENKIFTLDFTPNDSLLRRQWALGKIKAYDAWNITQGEDSVVIAIIDTGIDYLHPDLASKININRGESGTDAQGRDKRTNGVDDDNNGFVDDYMGWDFTDRAGFPFDTTGGDYLDWDNDPMDENGFSHGTACAGIIGAQTNNTTGIAGVAPNIRLMNLRAFDPVGYGEEDDVAAAILYAVANNAKVISMSFGDYSFSYVLRDVIRYAYSRGVVLVASAGNSNSAEPHYPSGYSEVISVGNSTQDDTPAASSNYGSTLDLMAPGTGIVTTYRNNLYSEFNGTSAAAPFVSAAAGLILSKGNFSNEEVKQILKSSTDDIGAPGWDLRTGAGRINIERALRVLSPSVIKFDYPKQDQAKKNDTLNISATILSAYFVSYSLQVGIGSNPTSWLTLINKSPLQVSGSVILNYDLQQYVTDTTLTFRLIVEQTNGLTAEERVNIHILNKKPEAELISLFPAYYGERQTLLAAAYTNQPCYINLYYRKQGTGQFKYFSLDGFTINNKFVKNYHYGFVPGNEIDFNSNYEIYLEAVNLAGEKTEIKDNGNYFIVNTQNYFRLQPGTEKSYTLPPGSIFDKVVSLADGKKGVFLREDLSPEISKLFTFDNGVFGHNPDDTLKNKILKDIADIDGDGTQDLLTLWSYTAFLYKQSGTAAPRFDLKFKADTSFFWPMGIYDLAGNGTKQLLAVTNDTTVSVYDISSDYRLTPRSRFYNSSDYGYGGNYINSPNALLVDSDKDGKNEIWMVDTDGDILVFDVNSVQDIRLRSVINTGFYSSSQYLSAGDFNGDGKEEIAVILQSIDELDLAPYYRVAIFRLNNNSVDFLFDNGFVNPANEYRSSYQKVSNSIKMSDVDNDGKADLVLFIFPYAYIIKHDISEGFRITSFNENINSNTVLIADFDGNGLNEIAFPYKNVIKFREMSSGNAVTTPSNFRGFSYRGSSVTLSWVSENQKFYIYKGSDAGNTVLYDSVSAFSYNDLNVSVGSTYYYSVASVLPSGSVSEKTAAIKVVHHPETKLDRVVPVSSNSVEVTFTGGMNKTIPFLESVFIKNQQNNQTVYPNSISARTEKSYLVSFAEQLQNGNYLLGFYNLTDLYGSPISDTTLAFTFTGTVTGQEFYIRSFELTDPFTIKIAFNLEVDENAALNTSNYHFEPANNVTSVTVNSSDRKIIFLNLKGNKPVGAIGKEYRLTVKNLTSSTQSGAVAIRSGAGASIVLTGFSENLEEVYVYPNPVNVSKNNILTFAGLPRRAEILVLNLQGEKLIKLTESDGNGGISWDMKDEFKTSVPSGIYIARVAMLDDSGNEKETKLIKFTIVR